MSAALVSRVATVVSSVLLSGVIAHASELDSLIAESVHRVTLGDWNGDGSLDILTQGRRAGQHSAISRVNDSELVHYWRDGAAGFIWNSDDVMVVPGDYDGDASTDLILQSKKSGLASRVVHSESNGVLNGEAQEIAEHYLGLQWSRKNHKIHVGDFNGDSRDDLFLQGVVAKDRHALLLANENGQFDTIETSFNYSLEGEDWAIENTSVATGDFNGDGKSELFIQSKTYDGARIIGNDASWFDRTVIAIPEGHLNLTWLKGKTLPVIGDFDGNGRDDLFLYALTDSDISALLPSSDAGFQQLLRQIDAIPNREKVQQVLVGDFDSDGIDDLILIYSDKKIAPAILFAQGTRLLAISNALRQLGLLLEGQSPTSILGTAPTLNSTENEPEVTAERHSRNVVHQALTKDQNTLRAAATTQSSTSSRSPVVSGLAVGRTVGIAAVDGGASTYSTAIAIPPGRNGWQPNLALNYSSRNGNGTMGVGWSLNSGGSAVHRCDKTVAQDGVFRTVRYDNEDKLCLDGQKLILEAGTYGADGATYRTEIESYVRVRQLGGIASTSSSFELVDSNGNKRIFQQTVIAGGLSIPHTWLVTKQLDPFGNNIVYSYQGFGTGETLLTQISYTGFDGATGDRQVVIQYEGRQDAHSEYHAGGLTERSRRIWRIQTFINSEKIREYTFGYVHSNATQRSLLDWFQECAFELGITYCLPHNRVRWNSDPISYENPKHYTNFLPTNPYPTPGGKINAFPAPDLNGDGRAEIILWDSNPGTGANGDGVLPSHIALFGPDTASSGTYQLSDDKRDTWAAINPKSLDLDGDGRAETWGVDAQYNLVIYGWSNDFQTGSLVEVLKTDIRVGGVSGISPGAAHEKCIKCVFIADLNADGYDDLVLQRSKTTDNQNDKHVIAYLNIPNTNGGGRRFAASPVVIYDSRESISGDLLLSADVLTGVEDWNGDGVPDLQFDFLGSNNDVVMFMDASLSHSSPYTFAELGLSVPSDSYFLPGDFNGDGLKDVVVILAPSGLPTWHVQFNTGRSPTASDKRIFTAPINLGYSNATELCNFDSCKDYGFVPKYAPHIQALDTDGNGAEEIIVPNGTYLGSNYCLGWLVREPPDFEKRYIYYYTTTANCNVGQPQDIRGDIFNAGKSAYDYAVYNWSAIHVENYSRGITASLRDTKIKAVKGFKLFDLDGNGLPDILGELNSGAGSGAQYIPSLSGMFGENKYGPYFAKRIDKGTDLLESVVDGFNVTSSFQYNALSMFGHVKSPHGTPFYSVIMDAASRYIGGDYHYFTSSMQAVSAFSQSDGMGGALTTYYGYEDAVYDRTGRGFQGFRKIIEETPKGIRQTTTFAQKFPVAGMMQTSVVERISDGQDLVVSNQTLRWRGPNNGLSAPKDAAILALRESSGPIDNKTYLPYVLSDSTTNRDVNGALLGTVNRVSPRDSYGCNSGQTVTTSDSYITHTAQTAYSLTSDPSLWWLCKKDSESLTVTSTEKQAPFSVENGVSRVRSTTFTYTPERRPDVVTVEGELFTDHDYDQYGNVIATTVSGGTGISAISARTNRADYSYFAGYFPRTLENALGQRTTQDYYPAHGGVKSKTDPLGTVTNIRYDAFGRPVRKQAVGTLRTQTAESTEFSRDVGSDGVPYAAYKVTTTQTGIKPQQTIWFDQLDRKLRIVTDGQLISSQKVVIDTRYDKHGRITRESVPYFINVIPTDAYWTRFGAYDVLDRPASKTLPNESGGLVISYSYNGPTTQIQVGSDDQYVATRTRNALGQWWQVVDQGSESTFGNGERVTTSFRYDAFGNPILISRRPTGGAAVENTASYNDFGYKTQMSDPDRGTWQFSYNVVGELAYQKDAEKQETWFGYDRLGRVVSRYEAELGSPKALVASWTYGNSCLTGVVTAANELVLCSSTKTGEVNKSYLYDSEGLLKSLSTSLMASGESSKSFAVSYDYDSEGRVKTVTYPNGRVVTTQGYSANGYPSYVDASGLSSHLHEVVGLDAFGNVLREVAGNGLDTTRQFSPFTGRMASVCVNTNPNCTVDTAANVQSIDYGGANPWYSEYGDLQKQYNRIQGVTETFQYDRRRRLTQSKRDAVIGGGFPNLSSVVDYRYDALGNLVKKTDFASALQYGNDVSRKPHQVGKVWADAAMTQLIGQYAYDLNGNLTNSTGASGRTLAYNHQQVPVYISKGTSSSSFYYDESNERYFEKHVEAGKTTKTWKIGKLFEHTEVTVGGSTSIEEKHYVGGQAQLSYKPAQNGKAACKNWRYFHVDRLGSIETITTETGLVAERRGFDPFGKPRQPNLMFDNTTDGTTATEKGLFSAVSTRGFTGHDHIDAVGLIHMNGRAFDPQIGRFLSVDPLVQSPLQTQSWNGYSYINNNPLAGTDPTGYFACEPGASTADCAAKGEIEDGAKRRSSGSAAGVRWGVTGPSYRTKGNGGKQTVERREQARPMHERMAPSNQEQRSSTSCSSCSASHHEDVKQNKPLVSSVPPADIRQPSAPKVVDSTGEALSHYVNGNGEEVELGPKTQEAIKNSEDQKYRSERIQSGETPSLKGSYGVNVEKIVYHVGDTPIFYETKCSGGSCTTTYTNKGDGFWDPFYDSDGRGPQGEFGTPFGYKSFQWSETYPNPYR